MGNHKEVLQAIYNPNPEGIKWHNAWCIVGTAKKFVK